ncbi:non-heme iron oxygenase ferredoxin subunit [Raineyella sp.]|uniref:non-heme iron oxygenase ferredoxin subunit n=1 Tax=Raineyella sp. TaxID=1911550 RepID=UPI002B1F0005|nr:non-heme iron oxygenase ferredoxin subunit [Raineyella sp.]MEA5154927.1 non-heme iron oxygenase ferredoxin subunit [Raineyella sp.]
MTDSARRGPSPTRWLRRALGISAHRATPQGPDGHRTPGRPRDRTSASPPPEPLPPLRVTTVDALEEGSALVVDGAVNGTGEDIAVFRSGGHFYALNDICTHRYASLSDGWIAGDRVECPVHQACFSLRTGEALCPPATVPEPTHRVEVRGDEVWLWPGHPADRPGQEPDGPPGRNAEPGPGGGAPGRSAGTSL